MVDGACGRKARINRSASCGGATVNIQGEGGHIVKVKCGARRGVVYSIQGDEELSDLGYGHSRTDAGARGGARDIHRDSNRTELAGGVWCWRQVCTREGDDGSANKGSATGGNRRYGEKGVVDIDN